MRPPQLAASARGLTKSTSRRCPACRPPPGACCCPAPAHGREGRVAAVTRCCGHMNRRAPFQHKPWLSLNDTRGMPQAIPCRAAPAGKQVQARRKAAADSGRAAIPRAHRDGGAGVGGQVLVAHGGGAPATTFVGVCEHDGGAWRARERAAGGRRRAHRASTSRDGRLYFSWSSGCQPATEAGREEVSEAIVQDCERRRELERTGAAHEIVSRPGGCGVRQRAQRGAEERGAAWETTAWERSGPKIACETHQRALTGTSCRPAPRGGPCKRRPPPPAHPTGGRCLRAGALHAAASLLPFALAARTDRCHTVE